MSQSWTSGYVADIAYIEGFYVQQSPARMVLACLSSNVAVDLPEPDDAACYLELGCGCGIGALLTAASGWAPSRSSSSDSQYTSIRAASTCAFCVSSMRLTSACSMMGSAASSGRLAPPAARICRRSRA